MAMFSRPHVGVDDFERAFAFHSAVLLELDGTPGGGSSEALPAFDRTTAHGAYFGDPAANQLCICCHQPEPT